MYAATIVPAPRIKHIPFYLIPYIACGIIMAIGGYFNLPDWDWEQNQMKNRPKEISYHKEFINILNDNGLSQLVTKPTRLQNTLDLMITNNPTRVNSTEMLLGISDHEICLCELDISSTKNKQVKRSIPLYRKADWELLSDHITNIEI